MPQHLAFTPSGEFLYVSNTHGDNITAFAVDEDGNLAAASGSPFDADPGPQGICVHSSGRWAYVVHCDANVVSIYTIDAATGALSPHPDSPVSGGGRGWGIACATLLETP